MIHARVASLGFVLAAAFAFVGCGGQSGGGPGMLDESNPEAGLAASKKLQDQGLPPPVAGNQGKKHGRRGR